VKTLAEVRGFLKSGNVDLGLLVGAQVTAVEGYASLRFDRDTPTFKLVAIHFADGSKLHVEGEHDHPYLPVDGAIEAEQLLALADERDPPKDDE
jgi:hypothetical protein